MIQLMESVLIDLIAMAKTARNPAAKKLLALRVHQIQEALVAARV